LAPADRGPAVDIYKDAGRCAAGGELGVGQLGKVAANRVPVPPHDDLAGQPLDDVDAGIAALRPGIIAGRQVNPERSLVRVMQRVGFEQLALEEMFVVTPLGFEEPGWKLWHDATIRSGHHTLRLVGGGSLAARLPRLQVARGGPRRWGPGWV